jgi:hypothetical protein
VTPAEARARLTFPGDPDIDLDVDNITLTAVVRIDHEFLVRAVGGFGWWHTASGAVARFEPGDPESSVTEVNLRVGLPDMSPAGLDRYEERLCRWRDGAVPLRLISAPTRMASLIADRDDWLPLPRTPPLTRTD